MPTPWQRFASVFRTGSFAAPLSTGKVFALLAWITLGLLDRNEPLVPLGVGALAAWWFGD